VKKKEREGMMKKKLLFDVHLVRKSRIYDVIILYEIKAINIVIDEMFIFAFYNNDSNENR